MEYQAKKRSALTLNFPTEPRLLMVKTILAYEAGVRGLSTGQTLSALIFDVADRDAYPDEVIEELDRLEESRARNAKMKSIKAALQLARSA